MTVKMKSSFDIQKKNKRNNCDQNQISKNEN